MSGSWGWLSDRRQAMCYSNVSAAGRPGPLLFVVQDPSGSPKRTRPAGRMLFKPLLVSRLLMSHLPRHKIRPRFKGWRYKFLFLMGREAKSHCKGTLVSNGRNHHSVLNNLPHWHRAQFWKLEGVLSWLSGLRITQQGLSQMHDSCTARFELAKCPKIRMI